MVRLVAAYYSTGIWAYMHGSELEYHPHKHEAQRHAKNLFLPEYNIIMNYVIQKKFRKLGM